MTGQNRDSDRRSSSARSPTRARGRIRIVGYESDVDALVDHEGDADTHVGRESEADHRRDTADVRDGGDHGTADGTTVGDHRRTDPDRPSYRSRPRLERTWRRFRSNRAATIALLVVGTMALLALFARPLEVSTMGYTVTVQPFSLAPHDPTARYVGPAYEPPTLHAPWEAQFWKPAAWRHPFGTDAAGRDVFSRVLVGARYSLSIGLLAVGLALAVGIPVGAVAGYYGGWIDELCMRLVDTLYAFPFLVLAIALVAVLGSGFWNLIFALVVTGWLGYARLIRGEVLSITEREYVLAARSLGATDRRILAVHVVPNALAPVLVQATLNVGTIVLAAAALGFLGLGLEPGTPEWGTMLASGRESLVRGHWHVTVFPGLAIFLFVLAINLVGDAAGDALQDGTGRSNPETEKRRLR
ncbi:ABC transporter permease [Natrialbaceae archaeon GCM10025810]|uniref:ABC transporter permease n=1 Tax=Halovalidus salilacus TaxID=3075124 RepID=UPI00361BB72A